MLNSLFGPKSGLVNFKVAWLGILILTGFTYPFLPGLQLKLAEAAVTIEGEIRTCRDTKSLAPYSESWVECLQDSFDLFEESGKKPSVDEMAKAIHKIWRLVIRKDPGKLINTLTKLKSRTSGGPAYTVAEAGAAVAQIFPSINLAVVLRAYRDTKKLAPGSGPWERCLQDTFDNFEARGKKPSIDEMAKSVNDIWKPNFENDPLKLINALTKLKSKKSGRPAYPAGEVNTAVVGIYRDKMLVFTVDQKSSPASPPGLKLTRGSCPVIKWWGYTYWAYSHNDNRVATTIIAYDAEGRLKQQWYRKGARYVSRITVDSAAKTATFWGQGNRKIVMKWQDLEIMLVAAEPMRNHPAVPPGLDRYCTGGPNQLQPAPACPVIKWHGYTYRVYDHSDNRVGLTIIAYDAAGQVKKKWYKKGARYLWKITVDPAAKTVTFWGQSNRKIAMKWQELQGL